MSLLADKIRRIINKSGEGKNIIQDVEGLKRKVEEKLENLSRSGNLQVHDPIKGGVLRGPVSSRKKLEELPQLLCNERYMIYGKGGVPSEVPYMRALFNSQALGTGAFSSLLHVF